MNTKIITFLAFCIVCLNGSAHRTQADIEQILNQYPGNNPHIIVDDYGSWNQMPREKEVSLKNAHTQGLELDSVEIVLLSVFDDIIVNRAVPNAYFLKYSDLIGVAKLDGSIVVPPVAGRTRKLDSISGLRVGDLVSYSQIEDYFMKRIGKHKYGYAGIVSAVLDDKTLDPIIPFGVYDYILFTAPSSESYYVAQKHIDENGEMNLKWGYLDGKGNEIIPCIYKAIVADEHENLVGSNTVDMLDYLSDLDLLRANFSTSEYEEYAPQSFKLSRSQKFWIGVADKLEPIANIDLNGVGDFFKSVGEGIIRLDESLRNSGFYEAMAALQNYTQESEYDADPENGNYAGTSSNTSSNGRSTLGNNQSYNSDKRTYNNYDSMLSAYYAGNRNASSSEVSQWKREMKRLREKWESQNKSFPHSRNEDR